MAAWRAILIVARLAKNNCFLVARLPLLSKGVEGPLKSSPPPRPQFRPLAATTTLLQVSVAWGDVLLTYDAVVFPTFPMHCWAVRWQPGSPAGVPSLKISAAVRGQARAVWSWAEQGWTAAGGPPACVLVTTRPLFPLPCSPLPTATATARPQRSLQQEMVGRVGPQVLWRLPRTWPPGGSPYAPGSCQRQQAGLLAVGVAHRHRSECLQGPLMLRGWRAAAAGCLGTLDRPARGPAHGVVGAEWWSTAEAARRPAPAASHGANGQIMSPQSRCSG